MTAVDRVPRFKAYSTQCARPNSASERINITGASQPLTVAAVLPANPSRAKTAAAVQFGQCSRQSENDAQGAGRFALFFHF